jgi:hypothetical protein
MTPSPLHEIADSLYGLIATNHDLSFSQALIRLKLGEKMDRPTLAERGLWINLIGGDKGDPPRLLLNYKGGRPVGARQPWLPLLDDLLANDWKVAA